MRSFQTIFVFGFFLGLCYASLQFESAPVIEILGNKFYKSSDKTQFFIRGVAYQRPVQAHDSKRTYVDSLALPSLCLKDLIYFKELGINTVRIYEIDPAANHDVCMSAFAAQGIYVLVDLPGTDSLIDELNLSWDLDLLQRYTAVVDCMHSYTNVIGFIAGNGVVTSPENSGAAAYVKASIRDTKNYMEMKKYRQIPVGYTSVDDSALRLNSANYFMCNDSEMEDSAVDFYAMKMYSWCGYSSFSSSGYKERTIEFALMPVPVFFSEYGCNIPSPRSFTEIEQIYGSKMTQVWSGGLLYEFFQKQDNFGLVKESARGKITKLNDFNTVRLRLVENVPFGAPYVKTMSNSRSTTSCPSVSATWRSLSELPPTPDEGTCECLLATLSCIFLPRVRINEQTFLTELCSKTDCSDILGNSTLGTYGKYSGCGLRQKISYTLNKYWLENNRNPEVCDFNKRAVLISNSEFTDLKDLRTPDGRTCKEALGDIAFEKQVGSFRRSKLARQKGSIHSIEATARSNDSASIAGYTTFLRIKFLLICFILFM